jgi:peroxiredoxin
MSSLRAVVFIVAAAAAGAGVALFLADRGDHSETPVASGSAVASSAEPAPSPEIGFYSPDHYDTGGDPFSDATIDDLMATLDELMARPETAENVAREANIHLWRYATRLAMGYITPEQETRLVEHLDGLAESYPEAADDLAATRFMVKNLMLGREAPDIVGKDLDGVEFRLSDYRGKVVAIVFTGEWCGPCRSEYPYQRLLLEVMDPEEFVLLGVNSDADVEVARQGKIDAELDYRAWWDGYAEENTKGPIATQWNVTGWPTIYVLDENGIIRRRGPRHEKLITAAKELVAEMNSRQAEGS